MSGMNADDMTRKLEDMLPTIRQVNEQFRDPVSRSRNPVLKQVKTSHKYNPCI